MGYRGNLLEEKIKKESGKEKAKLSLDHLSLSHSLLRIFNFLVEE
jgi:hypothetical protein